MTTFILTSFFYIWIKILKLPVRLKKKLLFRRFKEPTPRPLAPYIVLDGGNVDKNAFELMHRKGFLGYIQLVYSAADPAERYGTKRTGGGI
jgi:hypothetical protein